MLSRFFVWIHGAGTRRMTLVPRQAGVCVWYGPLAASLEVAWLEALTWKAAPTPPARPAPTWPHPAAHAACATRSAEGQSRHGGEENPTQHAAATAAELATESVPSSRPNRGKIWCTRCFRVVDRKIAARRTASLFLGFATFGSQCRRQDHLELNVSFSETYTSSTTIVYCRFCHPLCSTSCM
jgi:hypothetical protein